jgi:hypothetical protein
MSKDLNLTQDNWQETLLPSVYFYNNTIQTTVGYAPSYLLFGNEADHVDLNWIAVFNSDKSREEILNEMDIARDEAQQNILTAQQKYKEQYDKNRLPSRIKTGDTCLKQFWFDHREKKSKFLPYWEGFFKILEREGNNVKVVSLRPKDRGQIMNLHVSQLKQFLIKPNLLQLADGHKQTRHRSREEICRHEDDETDQEENADNAGTGLFIRIGDGSYGTATTEEPRPAGKTLQDTEETGSQTESIQHTAIGNQIFQQTNPAAYADSKERLQGSAAKPWKLPRQEIRPQLQSDLQEPGQPVQHAD